MRAVTTFAALALIAAGVASSAAGAAGPEFAISYPASLRSEPLDGRIILLLSRDLTREPRTHVEPNEPLASPYIFGLNVENLAPGHAAILNDNAFGWPARRLAALPTGDYLVQAVLNRYETFHLADGRTLKLPPDKGEGQQWAKKPGNLYSTPRVLHLDQDMGTVQVGKIADLIVLGRNPIESISNIRSVERVVAGGTLYETAPLWRAVGFKD